MLGKANYSMFGRDTKSRPRGHLHQSEPAVCAEGIEITMHYSVLSRDILAESQPEGRGMQSEIREISARQVLAIPMGSGG